MKSGYISAQLRDRIERQAKSRCGYCQSLQKYVLGTLEIDHLIPRSRGGGDDEENLWLACSPCNLYKGAQTHAIDPISRKRVRLFNPRRQQWSRHFVWSDDGSKIKGRTQCGRATVTALRLNNPLAVNVRQAWISVGWHPPNDQDS